MSFNEVIIAALVAGVLTALACGLGPLPLLVLPNISKRAGAMLTAAAAGMMTSASLVQLVGEGLRANDNPDAFWMVAVGLLAGTAFFALISKWVHGHEEFDIGRLREKGGAAALLIVAVMTIHSAPEGVAIGVGYGSGESKVGLPVALAIAVHNIPEGLAIALALRPRGVTLLACVGWAIFSSLPQPLMAVPSAWAVWISEPLLPAGMGFAAGAMTHLVVADLLPESTQDAGPTRAAFAFVIGVTVMIVLGRAVGMP